MIKTFKAIELEFFNTKAYADHRKRVNKLVISYTGEDGNEYRKSYEYPVNMGYNDMAANFPRIIN